MRGTKPGEESTDDRQARTRYAEGAETEATTTGGNRRVNYWHLIRSVACGLLLTMGCHAVDVHHSEEHVHPSRGKGVAIHEKKDQGRPTDDEDEKT